MATFDDDTTPFLPHEDDALNRSSSFPNLLPNGSQHKKEKKKKTLKTSGYLFTALRSTVEEAANFAYGVAGTANNIAAHSTHPFATAGFESQVFNTIPPVALAIGAMNMVGSLGDSFRMLQKGLVRDWRHFDNLLTIGAGYNLFKFGAAHQGQFMTLGSATFGLACDAFGIMALTNFIVALRRYMTLPDNNSMPHMVAVRDLRLSMLNLTGWGSLSAAYHLAGTATAVAAPALIPVLTAVGFAALALGGLYAGYNFTADYFAIRSNFVKDRKLSEFGITAYFKTKAKLHTGIEESRDKQTATKTSLFSRSI